MNTLLALGLLCFAYTIDCKLFPVPGVGYRPSECIHQVPIGSSLSKEKDGSVTVITPEQITYSIPPCDKMSVQLARQISDSGWIAYANFNAGNFSSYNGTWKVPKLPKSLGDGQIVYFFTGLEDDAGDEIIQPVLQYGADVDGGGEYWGIACWWVTSSDQYIYSTLVKVAVGDTIFGYMNLLPNASWLIGAVVNGKPTTALTMANVATQTFSSVTLEAYQMQSCDDYPNDKGITFTSLIMKDQGKAVTPTWTPNVVFTDCNQNVQSSGAASVTISY